MLFSGYKKLFLTFSEVKRVSQLIVLDILKVKSGKGGVQRSATQKAAAKAAENISTQNRKSSTKKQKQQKQQKAQTTGTSAQTTGAAHAEASCTNNKEHQTAATQEKSTKRISKKKSSKRSSKSNTNNSKSSAPRGTKQQQKQKQKLHKQYKQQRKQQKQQQRHEGPEGGHRRSLALNGVCSWNFGGVFEGFFEIPVIFITIGYWLFARSMGSQSIVKLFLTILEGQKRQGWVFQRSATQKRQQKHDKQQKKA